MTTLEAWKRSVDERLRKVKQQEDYQAQALAALRPQLTVSTSYAPAVNGASNSTIPTGWYELVNPQELQFSVESGSALVTISSSVVILNLQCTVGYEVWDPTTGEVVVFLDPTVGNVYDNRQSSASYGLSRSSVFQKNHKLAPGKVYGISAYIFLGIPVATSSVVLYDTLLTVKDLT